ncbi:hypothetical protein YC2023_053353 [Brassica napus]
MVIVHCQDPASVTFSVLSLAMHFHGWDVDITKRLDYSSAIVVLGFSLIVSFLRTFDIRVEAARSWYPLQFKYILEKYGDFGVFWSLLSAGLHRCVRCLAMDGYLSTRFELAFQCHKLEVNQHPITEVIPGLLTSSQSATREEVIENIKECRSMQHCAYRSIGISECGPSIFENRLKPRSTYILVPGTTMKRGFLGSSKKKPADSRTICKSTREESIDTLQAASIDSVHQKSIDNVHHQSIDKLQAAVIDSANKSSNNTIHRGTVHHTTIHPGPVYRITVHRDTVYRDTVHLPSIDIVHLPSVDTIHPASVDTVPHASIDNVHPDTVHCDTVHLNTVHPDTIHPVKNDTTCGETEKIEVLILKLDENVMLRDEEGRTCNNA